MGPSRELGRCAKRATCIPWRRVRVSLTAPRANLCAGAGHFAAAHVTLTKGLQIGGDAEAGEQVVAGWDTVTNRTGEIVPSYDFVQAEREVAAASLSVDAS